MLGDIGKERFGRATVRVDETDPFTILNVLDREIFEQRRFSHAGFPDDIRVPLAVLVANAKFDPLRTVVRFGEVGYFIGRVHWSCHTYIIIPRSEPRENMVDIAREKVELQN